MTQEDLDDTGKREGSALLRGGEPMMPRDPRPAKKHRKKACAFIPAFVAEAITGKSQKQHPESRKAFEKEKGN